MVGTTERTASADSNTTPCRTVLARFINDEVLPAVLANAEIRAAFPQLAFTKNPWGRATMGCSSGGAAALTMGWFRPDLFRRLITYSGTFVDQQDDDAPEEAEFPLGAWEYHSSMKLIEISEKKPLRIFTHVSERDNRGQRSRGYPPQLGTREPTHRRGSRREGLRLPLRLQPRYRTLRPASLRRDASRHPGLDVARLPCRIADPHAPSPNHPVESENHETSPVPRPRHVAPLPLHPGGR